MKTCSRCGRQYEPQVVFCSGDGHLLDAFDVDAFIGQVLDGRYRLEEKLGEGAHGVVFRATQIELDRRVAVKILHPAKVLHPSVLAEVPDVRDFWMSCVVRFQREARAAGRLHHPNIVAVTDFGHAPGDVVYMVMEFLDGPSLRQVLKQRGRLSLEMSTLIMRQVNWAVEAAHRQGVIHRDLKPANIIIERVEGLGDVAKVVDFGIAKLLSIADTEITTLTETGVFLGTPKYMSPEQCGGAKLDARSDIYSLGIVLYEMLTGVLPFSGTAMAVALQHTTTPPRPLRELNPDIPVEVERVVLRALAKQPDSRFPSASSFQEELERASGVEGVEGIDLSDDAARVTGQLPLAQRSRIEISIGGMLAQEDDATSTVRQPGSGFLAQGAQPEHGDVAPDLTPEDMSTHARAPIPVAPEGMVLVPPGPFLMGSERGGANERPVHEVFLDAYFIDATEVTNQQYRIFCDRTGRQYPPNPRWDSVYFKSKPNHPVVNVTWFDAQAFATWAGKRLPSEAEWEKAARGGVEGCDYPWGDSIDQSMANYDASGTCSVRTFTANGYGIFEIVGNVWEWCADWFADDAYRAAARVNPRGPAQGTEKVLRGGSIDGNHLTLRIPYRHWMNPSRRSSDIGFRCARDLK